MLDALFELIGSFRLLLLLVVAVPIGLFFGVVPGLGGKIAIIAMLPFVFAMDQLAGCVFLISLHAVVHTGGAVPAILFGIPGTGPSTAIVADGHALAQKGQAVRALTASSVASAVGGVFGAVVLALMIPFAREIVTYLSYPEIFFLTLFGILMAAGLSGDSVLRGLLTGALGLLIALVGIEHTTGAQRFTFGAMFLWDGIDLITAILAIYAVPEMIALGARGRDARSTDLRLGRPGLEQVTQGIRDVIVFRYLALRTSALGAITGFMPGLGGDVAAWVCYGHAAQTSPDPAQFGKGAIDGIIGPEAANNSKEGGSLAPTLFLGLPGSSGMAILLIALVPLGIDPGPGFLSSQPQLLWIMVWALVLSNILAAAMIIGLAPAFDRASRIDPHVIVPFVMLLVLFSIFLSAHDWRFSGIAAVLAVLGLAFKRLNWPRAPFVVAMILGPAAEDALVKSLSIWGPDFFLRPVSLPLMIGLVVAGFRVSARLRRVAKRSTQKEEE